MNAATFGAGLAGCFLWHVGISLSKPGMNLMARDEGESLERDAGERSAALVR